MRPRPARSGRRSTCAATARSSRRGSSARSTSGRRGCSAIARSAPAPARWSTSSSRRRAAATFAAKCVDSYKLMTLHTETTALATDEERALREAVGGIAASFGPGYYQQQVDDGGNCAELWRALGERGYLGVHLPEDHGGGGLGLSELALVV